MFSSFSVAKFPFLASLAKLVCRPPFCQGSAVIAQFCQFNITLLMTIFFFKKINFYRQLELLTFNGGLFFSSCEGLQPSAASVGHFRPWGLALDRHSTKQNKKKSKFKRSLYLFSVSVMNFLFILKRSTYTSLILFAINFS